MTPTPHPARAIRKAGKLMTPLLTAGDNYIYNTSAEHLLMMLPDASIDMILTSPPYDNLRTYKGFAWDFEFIAHQSYRVLKPGGVLVWVVGDSVVDGSETLTSADQKIYFRRTVGFAVHDTMIYQKDGSPFPESNRYAQEFEYMFVFSKGKPKAANLIVGRTLYGASETNSSRSQDGSVKKFGYEMAKPTRTLSNVWYITSGYMKTTKDKDAFEHPAMFPEKLAERHILTWSNPGDLVLDFFMGSGTTAKMARNNGRRFIGCDIAAEYVGLANKRLAKPYTLPLFQEAS
jgi:DNA modification methylase